MTGTRLRTSEPGAAPVIVFDRKRLDETGAATVGEVLRYLPQQPIVRADGFSATDSQFAQLRGLGVDFTRVDQWTTHGPGRGIDRI